MKVRYIFGLITLVAVIGSLTALAGDFPAVVEIESVAEPAPEPAPTSAPASVSELPSTTTTGSAEVLNVSVWSTQPIEPDRDNFGSLVRDHYGTTTTTVVTTVAKPPARPAPSATTTTTPPQTTAPPTTVAEPVYDGQAEAAFASNINGLRASSGLPPLSRSGSLDSEARSWARTMGEQGSLSHSNIARLIPPWSGVAENIASGVSVDSVFAALAGSGGHRSNMLGNYTHLGVGVWIDPNGRIWTVHVFTR